MSSSRLEHAWGCRWGARSGKGSRRRRRRRSRRLLLAGRWRAAAARSSYRGGAGTSRPPLLQAPGSEEGGRAVWARRQQQRLRGGRGLLAVVWKLYQRSGSTLAPRAERAKLFIPLGVLWAARSLLLVLQSSIAALTAGRALQQRAACQEPCPASFGGALRVDGQLEVIR